MEEDFIYWRHPTLPGIKVEEISGGETRKGATWLEMARQVYCENGRDSYREIGHFHNGAPFLFGEQSRISVTHCPGLLAVATLPSTPEVELGVYSRRAALGIDAERSDRRQVLDVRERFLSERELEMIPADDVRMNILAWTLKEAAYKAAFCEGLDLRRDIAIEKCLFSDLRPLSTTKRSLTLLAKAPVSVRRVTAWSASGCIVVGKAPPTDAKKPETVMTVPARIIIVMILM